LIVSDDVIKLRGRLVVPGAPRFATIHTDRSALVRREEHDVRVLGIDPERVIVVAAGRAFERGPRLAAVRRFIRRNRGGIYDVFVARIDVNLREVAAARPCTSIGANAPPRFTGIVRTVDATELRRIDCRIQSLWITRSYCDADASETLFECWQTFC
jgi:hypothetical protein